MNETNNKKEIIESLIEIIKKHDLSFKESNEILLNTIRTLESKKINF